MHVAVYHPEIGQDLFKICYDANPRVIEKPTFDGDTPAQGAQTPLHFAAKKELWKVKFLLDKGADINSLNLYGRTPIMRSAMNERPEIVKYLLEMGADTEIKDKDDKTLLDYCIERTTHDRSVWEDQYYYMSDEEWDAGKQDYFEILDLLGYKRDDVDNSKLVENKIQADEQTDAAIDEEQAQGIKDTDRESKNIANGDKEQTDNAQETTIELA